MLKSKFIAATLLSILMSTQAWATSRDCHYNIYAKAKDIPSIQLGSTLVTRGHASGDRSRGFARVNAAFAAEKCLKDAVRNGGRPASCRGDVSTKSFRAEVVDFDLGGLPGQARRLLCAAATSRGIRVRNFQIYSKVISRSGDVLRECSLPAARRNVPTTSTLAATAVYATSPYFNLFKGRKQLCSN